MSALDEAVKHIEYSADGEADRKWAAEARAELAALTAKLAAVERERDALLSFANSMREKLCVEGWDEGSNVDIAASLKVLDEALKESKCLP